MPRLPLLLTAAILAGATLPALAQTTCGEAERKMVEAGALRFQAREEARIGRQEKVCDNLDDAGDRYEDAMGLFEDCGRSVTAIEVRGAQRNLDGLKRMNGCL